MPTAPKSRSTKPAPAPRDGRTLVRPVSQVLLRLKAHDPKTDLFAATVKQVLLWLKNRAGRALPQSAWDQKSFELESIGAQRTAAVALDSPRYWSARLDDADKNTAQRTWVTEIGIGVTDEGEVLFGARLTCTTRGDDAAYDRSLPGFVFSIVERSKADVLLDGQLVTRKPVPVQTEDEVHALVDLLESPQRRHPVILFSVPEGVNDITQVAANANWVTEKTLGAAHVFVLTSEASFAFTEAVGRGMSVYRQSVRLYRPGFRRWKDDAYDHSVRRVEDIQALRAQHPEKPKFFEHWLVSQVLAVTAFRADREHLLPSFETVRRMAAQLQRKAARAEGTNEAELLALADEEIARLEADAQKQKDTYDGLLQASEQEREQIESARNNAVAEGHALRARIALLEKQLADVGSKTPIPDDLRDFESWCQTHLTGSVTLHSRAFRGVKQSVYENPTLLYEALLLLRDGYVPMRRESSVESKDRFEAESLRLKIDNSKVGEATKTHPEQYTIDHAGSRKVLDWHLKHGASRESTRCFRLYYFWDDETQTVVVGWLPSHLDNAMT
jgi:predicted RNase H-like nuclease